MREVKKTKHVHKRQKGRWVLRIALSFVYILIVGTLILYTYCVDYQNRNGKAEVVFALTIEQNSPTVIFLDEHYRLW